MKNTAYLFSFVAISFLMVQCQALHRNIPKADRNKRMESIVENTLSENRRDLGAKKEPEEKASDASVTIAENPIPLIDSKDDPFRQNTSIVPIADDNLTDPSPKDTVLVEAKELERAHKLVVKTTISVIFMIFGFPLIWIIATIITAQNIRKFEQIEYVEERDLQRMRALKILYYIFLFLPLVLLLALIFLLILLLI